VAVGELVLDLYGDVIGERCPIGEARHGDGGGFSLRRTRRHHAEHEDGAQDRYQRDGGARSGSLSRGPCARHLRSLLVVRSVVIVYACGWLVGGQDVLGVMFWLRWKRLFGS
jgi:hypothetical protein